MASIDQGDSPLNGILDPNVAVFKVSDDTTWLSGRDNVICGFYKLYNAAGPVYWPTFDPFYNGAQPNFSQSGKITGKKALWIDTDGTKNDKLNYTVTFNGDYISLLHAR